MKHLKLFNEGRKAKNKLLPIELETRVAIDCDIIGPDPGDKIMMDLLDIVGSIGHDDITFSIDWSDEEYNTLYKDYLVRIYGEGIKDYDDFILKCC